MRFIFCEDDQGLIKFLWYRIELGVIAGWELSSENEIIFLHGNVPSQSHKMTAFHRIHKILPKIR